MNEATTTILGIRHHGPGSARSLLQELEALRPDMLLIEGPADASALIPLVADPGMQPPVALLVYAPENPRLAAFYPDAAFSPEWVAIRWALREQVPVRFMDLPAGTRFAIEKAGNEGEKMPTLQARVRADPLEELARAAGDADGERFWDRLVESRRTAGDVFLAVAAAMAAVREAIPETDEYTLQREAAMRNAIRESIKEGAQNLAVVCGAWHAPALATLPPASHDARILKPLPRPLKTQAAWVPWTYERLAAASGYGAGIESPGWYEHLWAGEEPLAVSWMAKVAAVFREHGLDASAAHLIEAARLAETLAAMRGRSVPSLEELNEATRSVLALGSDVPLKLVRERLIVGQRLGEVPESAPTAPLAADLDRETRRLRFRPEPAQKVVDLDLRADTDRGRSHLLHRLALLDIPWGRPERAYGKSGTFHELWKLQWRPEFAVDLIAQSRFGNTILEAATARAVEEAREADALPTLTALIESVLLADLAGAVDTVVSRIGEVAAVGSDVPSLMEALPPLARILRYGNVRGTDAQSVAGVVDGLVARICVGLSAAAASLDDDAAETFATAVGAVHGAIALLDDPEDRVAWRAALLRLADQEGLHGLVAGRATRLLLDEGTLASAEATRRMRLALSLAADPAAGAAWVEGFLRDSGTILLHDPALFAAIDGWLADLPDAAFDTVLPLLRRTVSTFAVPERRAIGERVKRGGRRVTERSAADELDAERADLVLPILARILGAPEPDALR